MAGGAASSLSSKPLISCPVLGFLLVVGRAVGVEIVAVGVVVERGVVGKIMTIKEQVVDLSTKRSKAENASGSSWEGGNEMTVETDDMISLLPPMELLMVSGEVAVQA